MARENRAPLRRGLGRALACALLALVFTPTSVANQRRQTIVFIVNKKNPQATISRTQLVDIFLKQRRTWGNGKSIVPFNYKAGSALRNAFESLVLKMTAEMIGAYWIKQRVSGETTPPNTITSLDLVKRLVSSLEGAIGYIELSQLDGKVKALKIDGIAPTDPKYPYRYSAK